MMDPIEYQKELAKEFGARIARFDEKCQTYLDGLFNPGEEEEAEDVGDVEETLSTLK